MKNLYKTALTCLMALATGVAFAHGAKLGSITIAHPYAIVTPPGATTGGGYLKDVLNEASTPDALIGVTSPAADAVQIHDMRMEGDVMRMRAIPSLALVPGQHVAMQPGGGVHLMFIGLKKPWAVGDRVPATLQFEKAGKVDVIFNVEERGSVMEHSHAMTMP